MIEYWLEKLDALLDRECALATQIAEARRDIVKANHRGMSVLMELSRHDIAYRDLQEVREQINRAAVELAVLRQELVLLRQERKARKDEP